MYRLVVGFPGRSSELERQVAALLGRRAAPPSKLNGSTEVTYFFCRRKDAALAAERVNGLQVEGLRADVVPPAVWDW